MHPYHTSHTTSTMDAPLDGLTSMHFALIYMDEDGKLRFEASPSIVNNCQTILSPNVTDNFLRAVAMSGQGVPSKSTDETGSKSPLSPQTPTDGSDWSGRSSMLDVQQPKRKRVSHECVVPMNINCHQKTMLPVRNQTMLRRYYEKAFESLQQINCRILAKAYVKLVEPRKQVNFPYNGRKIIAGSSQQFDPELTKPAWWPSGVTHREPDHLLKAERIRLLVHILCELRGSHNITVEKLREADQSIRRQILPAERLQVLDEIYHVREEEERYLDGRAGMSFPQIRQNTTNADTDAQSAVCVYRVHLPDLDSHTRSPSSSLTRDLNPVYRKEVPDMESHTSVFPSTGGSPGSDTTTTPGTAPKTAAPAAASTPAGSPAPRPCPP
ncbi:hypothetical protein P168DRAFT_117143 [Aspergillus campestris IBT 28561]|uniref:Subtelomeric hrmA-associated cluster protein AFUB-079030/YDR124W-like helical bundle domain-containing protein n=1 Tax=Aspergillus campestris (strain IBT 28561) TaxID=1392248 RepID=A0A2I1D9W7_ASPC2|nr:uncharacterized protein P168DRAFT_117143 [Aspergillus campestris IBT 28561]PKY06680.1 hypothetical protein P168DRAFT_117143 [Aspergillus campestris IBT 28561]